jgi:hypothetical protein
VGFEPTIPAFEEAKTVHALDRADTVIGQMLLYRAFHFSTARVKLLIDNPTVQDFGSNLNPFALRAVMTLGCNSAVEEALPRAG